MCPMSWKLLKYTTQLFTYFEYCLNTFPINSHESCWKKLFREKLCEREFEYIVVVKHKVYNTNRVKKRMRSKVKRIRRYLPLLQEIDIFTPNLRKSKKLSCSMP